MFPINRWRRREQVQVTTMQLRSRSGQGHPITACSSWSDLADGMQGSFGQQPLLPGFAEWLLLALHQILMQVQI